MVSAVNLTVRFLLELCALAALAWWGITTGPNAVAKIGLGIGAPLLGAVLWGAFVPPNARVTAPWTVRLAVELAVFAAAVTALFAIDRPGLALALGSVYAVNRVMVDVWYMEG